MLDLHFHQNEGPDSDLLVPQLLSELPHIIAIDGPPGSGKTTMTEKLAAVLQAKGIPYEIVSTDHDVLPRDARAGKEIVDYHPGEIVRSAIDVHLDPHFKNGTSFSTPVYRTSSGKHDGEKTFHIPNQRGVLLVEGVRSIEHLLSVYGTRIQTLERILLILMSGSHEQYEHRRLQRDITQKGLSREEVQRRIETQRTTLADYYAELQRDLAKFRL